MPTAERYSRYREDQTTIWVSKTAADFLSRERSSPGEGAAAVLDRVLNEYRKMRRSSGGGTAGAGAATKSAAKGGAAKGGATKSAAKTGGAGTRGTRATRGAGASGGAKSGRRA
jgi:hypothetical protein